MLTYTHDKPKPQTRPNSLSLSLSLSLSHKRKQKLALRKTLLLATLILATTAIIAPPLVSSVQNIFVGLGQITDIQIGGRKIAMVIYQGQIIWERPKLQDGMNMQDATTKLCEDTPRGTTVNLKDQRDNKYCRVRKMADNRCWMIDNLAYDIGSSTGRPTYGPTAQLDTTPNGAPNLTSTNTVAQYAINTPAYNIPNNGNPTPSYLYNWCAAMADTSTNCSATVAYTAGQPATPQTGICPAPFRLPTVGATPEPSTQGNGSNQATASATTTNEFAKLDIWLGGTGINRQSANTYPNFTSDNATNPRFFWLGVFSGGYSSGLSYQGSNSNWWSSTAYSDAYTHSLLLYSGNTYVYPANLDYKNNGFAVRCLL